MPGSAGKKERHHKPWISSKTFRLTRERKTKKEALNLSKTITAKAATQEAYSQSMRYVKSSVKEDKRKCEDELAQESIPMKAKINLDLPQHGLMGVTPLLNTANFLYHNGSRL